MKRELITTTLLVTLTHEKHIPNITDFVANRLSTIEGMDNAGLTVGIVRPEIQSHLVGEEHPAEAFERMMKHLFSPVLMVSVTEEGKRQLAELLKQPNMHGVLEADTDSITTGHNMLMDVIEEHVPLLKTFLPVELSSGCGCAPLGDGTDAKCPRADGTLLCDDPLPAIAGGVVAGGMSHLSVDEVPVVLRDGDSTLIDEMKLKPFVYRHQPDEL